MKKGCLFLLVVLVASSFGYSKLLAESQFGDWWLSGLLGLSFTLVVANVWAIFQVMGQMAASNKPAHQWKDGELIGVSGRLQALRAPVKAPFSGKAATIVEYDVKRSERSGDSTHSVSYYQGFLMVPCAIHTQRGALRLTGFPLLTQIACEPFDEEDMTVFVNAAKYLRGCEFKLQSSNPLKALSELSSVLADDDGELKVDFRSANSLDFTEVQQSGEFSSSEDSASNNVASDEELGRDLVERGYYLEERVIPNGAEVTVFGTYNSKRSQIDIGSGIKNLSHQLHLGSLGTVLGRNMRRAVLGLLFWGAVAGGANWYVLKAIGIAF